MIVGQVFAQDTDFKPANLKLAPLYKYHIFTEGIALISGINLNLEYNLRHRQEYGDNVRLLVSIQKDEEFLNTQTKYPGKYSIGSLFSYALLTRRKHITYDLGPGVGIGYGDPNARLYLQKGYGAYKLSYGFFLNLGARYIFNKFPVTVRLSYMPTYNAIENRTFFLVGSLSLGYSFQKINDSYKKSTPVNCHTLQ